MELEIHGKQLDVGEALREHVTDKLEELDEKYFNHATSATVTFSKEGHGHGVFKVTISYLVSKGVMVNAEAEAGDAHGAFDKAAEKAAKRLRRNKKKLRDHHDRGSKTVEGEIIKARDYTLANNLLDNNEEEHEGDEPLVVAETTTVIPTITVSEAVMRLDLSGKSAMLFRNASNNGINMVYRREDGNVGWVDPADAKELAA